MAKTLRQLRDPTYSYISPPVLDIDAVIQLNKHSYPGVSFEASCNNNKGKSRVGAQPIFPILFQAIEQLVRAACPTFLSY